MAFLPILLELQRRKSRGQDCDETSGALESELGRFRRTVIRAMIPGGVLADESDVISTAQAAICTKVESFRGTTEGEAYEFCRRVVRNEMINYIRHVKKTVGHFAFVGSKGTAHAGQEDNDPEGNDVPAAGISEEHFGNARNAGPEDIVAANELSHILQRALRQLSQREQDVLYSVVVKDERIVDLSVRTGEPENNLTVRKRRALRKLAQLLPREIVERYGGSPSGRKRAARTQKRPSGRKMRTAAAAGNKRAAGKAAPRRKPVSKPKQTGDKSSGKKRTALKARARS